jgi:hypothetical protein
MLALSPTVRGLAYQAAQRMASRVYPRLPEESRPDVRADLAWLTAIICGPQST